MPDALEFLLYLASFFCFLLAAFSVRAARFILAAVVLAPLGAEALSLAGRHPGLPLMAVALTGLVAGATIWDALCRSARMRPPAAACAWSAPMARV